MPLRNAIVFQIMLSIYCVFLVCVWGYYVYVMNKFLLSHSSQQLVTNTSGKLRSQFHVIRGCHVYVENSCSSAETNTNFRALA